MLIPLLTSTLFPRRSTNIAELGTASTPYTKSVMSLEMQAITEKGELTSCGYSPCLIQAGGDMNSIVANHFERPV